MDFGLEVDQVEGATVIGSDAVINYCFPVIWGGITLIMPPAVLRVKGIKLLHVPVAFGLSQY